MADVTKLIISILLCEGLGLLGALAARQTSWYKRLKKPKLTPPPRVFGRIRALLYLLAGISFSIVWSRDISILAVIVFAIQLVLNLLWSFIFFRMHDLYLALMDLIMQLASVLLLIYLFYPVSHVAAYLLIPQLAWIMFVIYLNYTILKPLDKRV